MMITKLSEKYSEKIAANLTMFSINTMRMHESMHTKDKPEIVFRWQEIISFS